LYTAKLLKSEFTKANNSVRKLIQIKKNCIEIVIKILKSKFKLDLKLLKLKINNINDVTRAKIKE
jgi:hypothetical protein